MDKRGSMKIKEIRDLISAIEKSDDYEVNHISEDALMLDFIQYIADEGRAYSRLAKEILKINDIDQPRWCA